MPVFRQRHGRHGARKCIHCCRVAWVPGKKKQVLLVRAPQLHGAATPLVSDGVIVGLWEKSVQRPEPAETCAAKNVTHCPLVWTISLWLHVAGLLGGSLKWLLISWCLKSQPKDVGFRWVYPVVAVGCSGEECPYSSHASGQILLPPPL